MPLTNDFRHIDERGVSLHPEAEPAAFLIDRERDRGYRLTWPRRMPVYSWRDESPTIKNDQQMSELRDRVLHADFKAELLEQISDPRIIAIGGRDLRTGVLFELSVELREMEVFAD